MDASHLSAVLALGRDGQPPIGQDRIALVGAVARTGSISAAARDLGISYRAAWDSINILNNLLAEPVVIAMRGGRNGGRAEVTASGQALIAGFDILKATLDAAARRLEEDLSIPKAKMMRSFLMQTSTRNSYLCTVTAVTDGAVNSVVDMKLTDELNLTAVITERSLKEMGIHVGEEVYALVKAPFIILMAGKPDQPVSARNVITGTVAERIDGAVNAEIILDIGGGKTVTSIITIESADRLGLKVGDTATAMFKAGHVIVALP